MQTTNAEPGSKSVPAAGGAQPAIPVSSARRSIGVEEAAVWERWVLRQLDPWHGPANDARRTEGRVAADAGSSGGGGGRPAAPAPAVNQKLLGWGLPEDVARDALNPGTLRLEGLGF